MALSTSHDDGFREIQLSGKQLVFLFMAATVVLVVTFLTGVLVGRGVRAERTQAAQAEATIETPAATPDGSAQPAAPTDDPRNAAPPAPVEDGENAKASVPPEEQAPKAVDREAVERQKAQAAEPAPAPANNAPAAAAAKPAAAPEKPAAAKAEPPKPEPPKAAAAPVAAPPTTPPAPGSGYAVQVAAVNARQEADAIVKRLSGKSYSAYVEKPKGNASVFRVRVGPFRTRREAQVVAEKLKKEEKFKPWVTR